jgi:hypothetical protein
LPVANHGYGQRCCPFFGICEVALARDSLDPRPQAKDDKKESVKADDRDVLRAIRWILAHNAKTTEVTGHIVPSFCAKRSAVAESRDKAVTLRLDPAILLRNPQDDNRRCER